MSRRALNSSIRKKVEVHILDDASHKNVIRRVVVEAVATAAAVGKG